MPYPPSIRTDKSNTFAHHSMAIRVPGIIKETLAHNSDYASGITDNLSKLHDAVVSNKPIRLFSPPAPDYDLWASRYKLYQDQTWLNTEWLFAEMLLYRLMLEACKYWETLRDPFAPFKKEEMESDTLWSMLSNSLTFSGSREERLAAYLAFSLWGNRIDLSLKKAATKGTSASDDHLLTNDIPDTVKHLLSKPPGRVEIIMDNAGTEQAADLVLADYMLTENIASSITMHIKMQPVLVSDVIVADILELYDRMAKKGARTAQLATRLQSFQDNGRLRIVPDFYWNTAGRLWELPARIYRPMQNARLIIAKGDMNYRRATNDAIWPANATLYDALPDFPAPFLALRTLKSDTLVGVLQDRQTELDRQGESDWRTSGTYGVAQFITGSSQKHAKQQY